MTDIYTVISHVCLRYDNSIYFMISGFFASNLNNNKTYMFPLLSQTNQNEQLQATTEKEKKKKGKKKATSAGKVRHQ